MQTMRSMLVVAVVLGMVLTGTVQARAGKESRVTIKGTDGFWHVISKGLQTNACYTVTLTSTIKYSPSEKRPERLHIGLAGGDRTDYTFENKTKAKKIRESIQITAKDTILTVRVMDPDPTDNTGNLVVTVVPCKPAPAAE